MVGYAAVIIREHRAQRVDKLALHQRVPHKSTACQMVYLCARVDEGRVVNLLGVCGKKLLGQVFLARYFGLPRLRPFQRCSILVNFSVTDARQCLYSTQSNIIALRVGVVIKPLRNRFSPFLGLKCATYKL